MSEYHIHDCYDNMVEIHRTERGWLAYEIMYGGKRRPELPGLVNRANREGWDRDRFHDELARLKTS